jgi:hypothetical protein
VDKTSRKEVVVYYPHYYEVSTNNPVNIVGDFSHCLVIIALTDFTWAEIKDDWWPKAADIKGKSVYEPQIDIIKETHRFDKPEDAFKFIRTWWLRADPCKMGSYTPTQKVAKAIIEDDGIPF